MFNIKAIANTNMKALRYVNPRKSLSRMGKFIQRVCVALQKIRIKWRPIKYKSLIYEIAEFGPVEGFKYWWGEFCYKITFTRFRDDMRESIAYFKQGWKSRDFDSGYALDDFIWKLERLADNIEKWHTNMYWEKDVGRIRRVVLLLKKVRDDDYDREESTKLNEKWGHLMHYNAKKDDLFNFDVPCLRGGNMYSFSKREKENDSNEKQINKETRAAYRKAMTRRKKDWKEALKIIEEHFFAWWD